MWIIGLLSLILMFGGSTAVSLAQTPCEDSVRTLRILAEQYAASRQRTEIEAAQTIAGLLKQIDGLKAENEALKKGAK